MSDQMKSASAQAELSPFDQVAVKNEAKEKLKLYHPDRLVDSRNVEAEARDQRADTFYHVLSGIIDNPDGVSWSESVHQAEGRRIYFPRKGDMQESFVLSVRTPYEFLLLLKAYEKSTGLSDEDIQACEHAAAVNEEEREPEEEEMNFTQEAQSLAQGLAGILTLEDYQQWFESHEDSLHRVLLSSSIVLEGVPTTLRGAIGETVINAVDIAAKRLRTAEDFETLRQLVDTTRFYPTPHVPVVPGTRAAKIRGLVSRHVDSVRRTINTMLGRAYVSLIIDKIAEASPDSIKQISHNFDAFKKEERERPKNRRILSSAQMLRIFTHIRAKTSILSQNNG